MNSNSYWNAANPPWEEPEYEPVSPPAPGSNTTAAHAWDNINNFAKPRAHQLNLSSEPPPKRLKTLETPSLQPDFLMASPNLQAGSIPRPRPPATGSLQKTKLCARFEAGTCTFNDNCSFAHGAQELRRPTAFGGRGLNLPGSVNLQRFHKTRPCKFFLGGNCPYGERCNFLHDTEQGQFNNAPPARGASSTRPPNWKTKLCVNWENFQNCNFGDKCHFAHGFAELQKYGGGMLQAESGISVHGEMKPSNNFSASYSNPANNGFMHASVMYGSEAHNSGSGFTPTEASLSTVSYLNDNTYKDTNTLPYQNPQDVAPYQIPQEVAPYQIPQERAPYQNPQERAPYQNLQEGAPNYGYSSDPNDWERSGQEVRPDINKSQIYGQATHQGLWASHYYTTDMKSEREEPGSSSYSQNPLYP